MTLPFRQYLHLKDYKSLEGYHSFVNEMKDVIVGNRLLPMIKDKKTDKYTRSSVYYNVKVNPWKYITPSLNLNLNMFPIRRSYIPSYITLDGESLRKLTKTNPKV